MAEVFQARRTNLTNEELHFYGRMLGMVDDFMDDVRRLELEPFIEFHAVGRMLITLHVILFVGQHPYTPQGRVYCLQMTDHFHLLAEEL